MMRRPKSSSCGESRPTEDSRAISEACSEAKSTEESRAVCSTPHTTSNRPMIYFQRCLTFSFRSFYAYALRHIPCKYTINFETAASLFPKHDFPRPAIRSLKAFLCPHPQQAVPFCRFQQPPIGRSKPDRRFPEVFHRGTVSSETFTPNDRGFPNAGRSHCPDSHECPVGTTGSAQRPRH